MNDFLLITIPLSTITLIGTVLNMHKKATGFIFWMIASGAWCIFDLYVENYPRALLDGVFVITAFIGWRKWIKGEQLNGK